MNKRLWLFDKKFWLVFLISFVLSFLVSAWLRSAGAGFFQYTVRVTLSKDHKKDDVVKCATWFHDAWDSRGFSCVEAK